MAAFPIITPGITPVIITTANSSLSYEMILATLNYTSYNIRRLYLQADVPSQVNTQFTYNTVRTDGQQYAANSNGNIDPYQFLNVLDLEVGDGEMILDNKSVLEFVMQPFSTLQMYFFTDSASFGYELGADESVNEVGPAGKKEMVKEKKLDGNRVLKAAAVSALVILTLLYLFNNKKNKL